VGASASALPNRSRAATWKVAGASASALTVPAPNTALWAELTPACTARTAKLSSRPTGSPP